MVEREQVMRIFRGSGGLLEGHFLLSSGLHSPQYFQCAKVLQYPHYAELLCGEIAEHFADADVDVVIAPAIGGIVVAQEVGRQLSRRSIWAEREEDKMSLRRGFELQPGERVLVVEDVITTGGSVREVMTLATDAGCEVVGLGAIVDRSGGKATFEVELFSVMRLDVVTYPPDKCPLCQKGLPLVKQGSRKR